jgi:hypothetical protein
MMRADMDALMMTEENADLPYRSASPGLAHMCGHDGHMAALIGAAVLLNSPAVRSKFPSNSAVRLLFQPAEETPGGAGATSPQFCLLRLTFAVLLCLFQLTLRRGIAELGQLQPFIAVFPQKCVGQLASFGPT